MKRLDWHADRSDLVLLDQAPKSKGIDLKAVRRYRQQHIRTEMANHRVDGVILSDPVNMRYATGNRNMQVFSQRNAPARYLLLTMAHSILFEFTGGHHCADGHETIDEVRPAIAQREQFWAKKMAATIAKLTGHKNATIGLERLNAGASIALAHTGMRLIDDNRYLPAAVS